jgi:hypothetical protein
MWVREYNPVKVLGRLYLHALGMTQFLNTVYRVFE